MDSFFQEKGFTLVSKHNCPWSKKAKLLLKKQKQEFIEIKISQNNQSTNTYGYVQLKKCFRQETFPIIFDKNGKKIGGYEALKKYYMR